MTPGWLTFAQEASLPALAVAALMMAVVAAIKVWPQIKQLQIEGDASLRKQLMERVAQLEGRVKELEKTQGQRDAEHAAESQVLRHQLANEEAALDAFILLAEASPDRILEQIPKIKAMRESGRQRIALEKGAIAGAKVAAQGVEA